MITCLKSSGNVSCFCFSEYSNLMGTMLLLSVEGDERQRNSFARTAGGDGEHSLYAGNLSSRALRMNFLS